MVWNAFGVVTCRKEPVGGIIVVDFADSAKYRSLNMTDQMRFYIADVREAGLLLCSRYVPPQASSPDEDVAADAGQPSYIYFKPFASWGVGGAAGGEWRLDLPVFKPHKPLAHFPLLPGGAKPAATSTKSSRSDEDVDAGVFDTSDAAESAVAAVVGDGWCAVATDRQLLRFFRTSGLQVCDDALLYETLQYLENTPTTSSTHTHTHTHTHTPPPPSSPPHTG
jgi:hypothetical protein